MHKHSISCMPLHQSEWCHVIAFLIRFYIDLELIFFGFGMKWNGMRSLWTSTENSNSAKVKQTIGVIGAIPKRSAPIHVNWINKIVVFTAFMPAILAKHLGGEILSCSPSYNRFIQNVSSEHQVNMLQMSMVICFFYFVFYCFVSPLFFSWGFLHFRCVQTGLDCNYFLVKNLNMRRIVMTNR